MTSVGLVVAAHGKLAGELAKSARMIIGDQFPVGTVELDLDTNLEGLYDAMLAAIDEADKGEGVLVLIDLFGGTPSNAAALCIRQRNCAVVSGVSLPMLLEAVMGAENELSLESLARVAVQAGHSGIVDVRERLRSQTAKEQTGNE
ncbi:MAG: PTS sugar transporter subunit IIA [Anaerolineales bacterium]|jgi:mannose/fructose/sorbose-specific phosphotransferase system IIA component